MVKSPLAPNEKAPTVENRFVILDEATDKEKDDVIATSVEERFDAKDASNLMRNVDSLSLLGGSRTLEFAVPDNGPPKSVDVAALEHDPPVGEPPGHFSSST